MECVRGARVERAVVIVWERGCGDVDVEIEGWGKEVWRKGWDGG